MPITHITVRGARQHNLRDINIRIPRNTLTVVTGLSGSGKSSLAFDTIYAEGQRRYVETLSAYARQFLDQIERPDVDSIEGLSPAISIEQKTTSRSPRSTVGTITEIYDYLRLLYASIGVPHCPKCGKPISRQSAEQIVERILSLAPGERVIIYAPIVRGRKGEFKDLLDELDQQGFRARIDGEMRDLADSIQLERHKKHTIEAVIDRVVLKPGVEKRLETSVAKALQMANGLVLTAVVGEEEQLYSSSMACPDCGLDIPKLEPRSFSFNSTYGACPECHGLGSIYDFDAAKVITDWSKPLTDGALGPGGGSQYLNRLLQLAAQRYKIDLSKPFEELTEKQQKLLLYGPGREEAPRTGFHGILAYLRDSLEESKSESYRDWLLNYMSATICPACQGKRLRPESLAVKVGSLSIADFTALPLRRALDAARAHRVFPPRGLDRRAASPRGGGAAGISQLRRPQLSLAGSQCRHASPAAKDSAFAWPRKSVRVCAESSTCSMNLPSVCTNATTSGSSKPSNRCVTSVTRCWWWNTMKTPFAMPITSSTSVPARANWAATWSLPEPRSRSWKLTFR